MKADSMVAQMVVLWERLSVEPLVDCWAVRMVVD